MSANGLSVGKDITLNVHTPNGELDFIVETTSFMSKPDGNIQKAVFIDSSRRMFAEPTGYSGTFEIARLSNNLENFWAAYDAGWLAGNNIQPSTITETIRESNGSVSQYQYTGVALLVDEFGTYSGEGFVKQRISFQAANYLPR